MLKYLYYKNLCFILKSFFQFFCVLYLEFILLTFSSLEGPYNPSIFSKNWLFTLERETNSAIVRFICNLISSTMLYTLVPLRNLTKGISSYCTIVLLPGKNRVIY